MRNKIFLVVLTIIVFACNRKPEGTTETKPVVTIPALTYSYTKSFPHDTNSFTEGFLIHEGKLFESTGATEGLPQTRSLFGIVDTATGKINVKAELNRDKYFGEGITFLNGKVYQLTYKTKVGFIYDASTYKKLGEFTFPSDEGWGMTTDGKNLIMSDGTNKLTYLDPVNMKAVKTIEVSENGYVRDLINELEYVNGFIYANIWTTFRIVKIDPGSGKVVGDLDLTTLANDARYLYPGSMEMNGIAYDSTGDRFFVTGKMWPRIYELKIVQ